MADDMHVIESLPAYALGSLDEEETVEVAEHVAACPRCRAELASYQAVADQLALAAPDVTPAANLKQQLLDQIQAPHVAPVRKPRPSVWRQMAGLFQRATPAWGVASLVLLALLAISNLWWWQRVNRDEGTVTAGEMQIIALVGTDAAPDATGTVIITADGEYGTLVVDGLPVIGEDRQYQLWLIRDGQRTSGGVFSVNPEGYGSLWVSSPEPLSSYPAFGITIEPAGGSPGPTGDKVLGSSL